MKTDKQMIAEMRANSENATIIADNGGGLTLMLPGFAHHYYGHEQDCARDLLDYLASGTTEDWEGHEPEAVVDTDSDEYHEACRNGGYRELEFVELYDLDPKDDSEQWSNVHGLAAAIHSILDA